MKVVATAVGATLLTGAVIGGVAVTRPTQATPSSTASASTDAFFNKYVDDSGRVVRKDQGGDTVSEGQGYAMLLAVATRSQSRFDKVWTWTRDNLQRPDHLFSWHWSTGDGVLDPQSAADADLDIARALVLAGNQFGRAGLRRAGIAVGESILRLESAPLGNGRVLLPGPWASKKPPLLVDPSYYSPVAMQVLYRATHDSRWRALERGTGRVVRQVASNTRPPDWASVLADGVARPSGGPSGEPVTFGWDAVRVPIRLAESCNATDRATAASMSRHLATVSDPLGSSAVMWTARAASAAAAGHAAQAADDRARASAERKRFPTYYSDAWEALGRELSLDGRLGGCPPGATP